MHVGQSGKPVINLELNITANTSRKKLQRLAAANVEFASQDRLAA